MTRKKKSFKGPKFNTAAAPPDLIQEEKYRLENDSRTIRDYLDLKKDSGRHEKAIGHMRSEVDGLDELSSRKESMPRKSRKLGARNGRRFSRR